VLELSLTLVNKSAEESLTFENCLHTYFDVGDVTTISVSGLKGLDYLDKVSNFVRKTEANEAIRFGSEVDRIYLDATGPVEILDPRIGRRIRVENKDRLNRYLEPMGHKSAADAGFWERGIQPNGLRRVRQRGSE
jgi:D-hexose-6-phosphate mutarotase